MGALASAAGCASRYSNSSTAVQPKPRISKSLFMTFLCDATPNRMSYRTPHSRVSGFVQGLLGPTSSAAIFFSAGNYRILDNRQAQDPLSRPTVEAVCRGRPIAQDQQANHELHGPDTTKLCLRTTTLTVVLNAAHDLRAPPGSFSCCHCSSHVTANEGPPAKRKAQANLVIPGMATGDTGSGPQSYLDGARSSCELRA